jgi:hypothetical protein
MPELTDGLPGAGSAGSIQLLARSGRGNVHKGAACRANAPRPREAAPLSPAKKNAAGSAPSALRFFGYQACAPSISDITDRKISGPPFHDLESHDSRISRQLSPSRQRLNFATTARRSGRPGGWAGRTGLLLQAFNASYERRPFLRSRAHGI